MQHLLWILFMQLLVTATHAACSRNIVVPFSEQGADQWLQAGERRGLSIDYLEELSRRSGCHFVYVNVPRARAWWMFTHEQADLLPGTIRSALRDQYGQFHSQETEEGVSLISLDMAPLDLHSSDAIAQSGLNFAVVRGHDYGPRTARLTSALAARGLLVLAKDPASMLRMLHAGRIAGAIVLASVITTDAESMGLNEALTGVGIDDLDWTTTGLYLNNRTLTFSDQQLLTETITALNAEGLYQRLAKKELSRQPGWVKASIRLPNVGYDRGRKASENWTPRTSISPASTFLRK